MGFAAILVAGCASLDRMQATQDAIDKGWVEGLGSSNHLDAIVWSFPAEPLGALQQARWVDSFIYE
jgi:hypothetical protein